MFEKNQIETPIFALYEKCGKLFSSKEGI